VVFLDKPQGWTSRKAVDAVIRAFSSAASERIKAGHAGTLDPLATGMLPVLLGEATRFAALGLAADKIYRVRIDLSIQTDTLDIEGRVMSCFNVRPQRRDVERVLARFRGTVDQVPPAYSAVRVGGRRAYQAVRRGEAVELAPRRVEVHALDLLDYSYPMLTLRAHVSKGTYIRALARDIGAALGAGGCVTTLRRESAGGWPSGMMVSMEEVERKPLECLHPLETWLQAYPRLDLGPDEAVRFVQGQRLPVESVSGETVTVFHGCLLLGMGRVTSGTRAGILHPTHVLPSAQERMLQ